VIASGKLAKNTDKIGEITCRHCMGKGVVDEEQIRLKLEEEI
jgi:hypothetical protein